MTPAQAKQVLYLASLGDKKIDVFSLNEKTGKITLKSTVKLPGNAGPLSISPCGHFMYAAMTNESADKKASIATLKKSPDGSLKLLRTSKMKTRAPYIRIHNSGKLLLAAHYGSGEVTTYRVKQGLCTDEMLDAFKTFRTAHCIEIDPSGRFAFVPHTSPNRVYQFVINAQTQRTKPNTQAYVDGPETGHYYHQPRHYAHHPTLSVGYTSNERGGGITVWNFDSRSGTLQKMQTLSTLPVSEDGSKWAAADIQITPNGKFVYVSNRHIVKSQKEAKDTLAGFSIDPKTGRVTPVGRFRTEWFSRSFCIDKKGKFIFAAGQRSNQLAAFRIGKDGKLKRIATYKTGKVPIWVTTAEVE